MSQNLGRPTRRDLDFFENVFLDVDRLDVLEGFQLVVHAGQPGGFRQVTLAISGRMTTDGTGLTVSMQNVTARDARQRQRATTLNVDFVGLECGIVHLQIVGHNQSQVEHSQQVGDCRSLIPIFSSHAKCVAERDLPSRPS